LNTVRGVETRAADGGCRGGAGVTHEAEPHTLACCQATAQVYKDQMQEMSEKLRVTEAVLTG